ncbi:MAG: sigma 54-interacting transcriptional regulator [Eubacteriales bacterium]|nr:sigma 54-interacting transcriptional regulator [Eubacteriales bacterium]
MIADISHIQMIWDSVELQAELDKKAQEWESFQKRSVLAASVNPMVAQSWIRSKSMNVDPYNPKVHHLSEEELAKRVEDNKVLLQYARPLMDKLAEVGGDHISLMSLHDKDGYMLELNDRQDARTTWRDDYFHPGVRWTEADVGTNGIGLVLEEHMPVQIIGQEHYCYRQRRICCCAAPICDEDGELLGVVNVCSQQEQFTPYMMTLVVLVCYAIENQISAYQSFEMIDTVFNVMSDGVMILDRHMNVVRCSVSGAEIFKTTPINIVGNHIQDIVHVPDLSRRVRSSRETFLCRECNSYFNGRQVRCDITATPVYSGEKCMWVALSLKASKSVAREAAAVVGNFARYRFEDILTKDESVRNIIANMKTAANTSCEILISGESGTGKSLFAHAIHNYSDRRDEPFVVVNCAALPRELVEIELFGCEKDAFSGALRDGNPGKIELSNGGTIFLNEIGVIPLEIQPKLLRVLDTHRLLRINGKIEKELDIRVIASASGNLYEEVRRRNFREDLYYRLNTMSFYIPPLRERPGDLACVASATVQRLNLATGSDKALSEGLLERLGQFPWPGNTHELQNAIVRAFYCCPGKIIGPEHMADCYQGKAPGQPDSYPYASGAMVEGDMAIAQRQMIIKRLREYRGDIAAAASSMNVSRATMYRRLKKLNINLKTDV